MNPEIKARWIATLRNTKYKQGIGHLCINNHYCCLGVLLEVAKDDLAIVIEDLGDGNKTYDGRVSFPEKSTMLSLFGDFNSPIVNINGTNTSLVTHNDDGRTFLEIADAIESQL